MTNYSAFQAPFALWQQMTRMAWDSQMVIALRTAGMCGLLPQDLTEPHRMVLEKADAATEAMQAALREMGRGSHGHRVMAAAMGPYRRRARANVRRLSRKK